MSVGWSVGPSVRRMVRNQFFLNAENEPFSIRKSLGSPTLTLINVLGVLSVLNVLNVLNVPNVLNVLNVHNIPMDASLGLVFILSSILFG